MPTIAANDNTIQHVGPFPPTAKIATALGSKYYFTGKPCARGHVSIRYAHGSCVQCKAEHRAANRQKNADEARQWRIDNPEKCKEYAAASAARGTRKRYYLATKDKQIKRALAWNAANPEKARANTKRWADAHPEHVVAYRQSYVEENKESIDAYARRYREENREELAAASREWRRANPEKSAAVDRNKKAVRKAAPGTHTAADIETILRLQNFKCAECGVSVEDRTFRHVDHIIPLSRGGSNDKRNLQVLCPPCNMEKHATDPIVFAQRKGRLL